MAIFGISFRGITGAALAAVLGSTLTLGGCAAGGVDVEFDAPILNAVGVNLSSKKKDEADLPERQGLVVPPTTSALPPPGERANAAQQSWPDDPDLRKKNVAEAKAAADEKYCREGDWSGKGGIGEYGKTVDGNQQRCPSELGEALNKSFGGRPSQ